MDDVESSISLECGKAGWSSTDGDPQDEVGGDMIALRWRERRGNEAKKKSTMRIGYPSRAS